MLLFDNADFSFFLVKTFNQKDGEKKYECDESVKKEAKAVLD